MQNLEQLWSNLSALTTTALNEPFASLTLGAFAGVLLVVILSSVLQERYRKKCIRIQEDADIRYSKLQLITKKTSEKLANLDQIHRKQAELLSNTQKQNAQLHDQAKASTLLEEQVAHQIRKIEALTTTLESQFEYSIDSPDNNDPLSKHEIVINHLTAGLQKELAGMHDQIAEQSRQITNLENELAHERESLAEQIVAKSQALPKRARKHFDEQVVDPIFQQIDGLKEKVHAIPVRTKNRMEQHIVVPLHNQIDEITTTIKRTPTHISERLNQEVMQPINQFVDDMNKRMSAIPEMTTGKINKVVIKPLSALIEEISTNTRQMPEHLRDIVQKSVLNPLVQQLANLVNKIRSSNEKAVAQIRYQLIRPAGAKVEKLVEAGKSASINAIKKTGENVVQSIRKQSAVTPAT